jgi:cytochrome c
MVLHLPAPTRQARLASTAAFAASVLLPVAALAGLGLLSIGSAALAEGDAGQGAQVYRACVACHALEPGLHLSGPSLDGVFGRMTGTAKGFVRYSEGLKDADFFWNAAALDGWFKDPMGMIPGTYMTFGGIDDAQARADLIAFLQIAGQPGGGKRAVDDGLIPAAWLRAGAPEPVGDAPPQFRVTAVRHCGDSYFITTGDGRETPYWEKNIRLKVDSVETGPPAGIGVILGASMAGDRFSVVFSSLADLKHLVAEGCEAR